jgi:predicted AlkP superfamily phosphohydrolase/phosphomutase
MSKSLKQKLAWVRNFLIFKKYDFLAKANKTTFRVNPEANFVVSIASYPKRAHLLPAVYEALNNQTTVPQKWLLVLSEEEWPNLELPNFLKIRKKRIRNYLGKKQYVCCKKISSSYRKVSRFCGNNFRR